jgi:acetyl-CoA acetyltransferase family protein
VRPDDLLSLVLEDILIRTSVPADEVDEVVAGCANQAGEDNRNVARMALLLAGYPDRVPGLTVNRLCASGLSATTHAFRAVSSGEVDVVVAGGVESMSRAPYVMRKPSTAYQRGAPQVEDTSLGWRFLNPRLSARHPPLAMGETAERLVDMFQISRQQQDEFALRSHVLANQAWDEGRYHDHVLPVTVAGRRGEVVVDRDEGPRRDTSLEVLAGLKTAFRDNGTVTAGNSSPLSDGAGALLVASEDACNRLGLTPKARIVGTAQAGVDPSTMGIGPVPATKRALDRAGWAIDDLDSIELNEAFASQCLAVLRELGLPAEKVNPDGGAIALGHPLGMSGIRLIAGLIYRMARDTEVRRGLATACVGVGQGESILVERA